MKHKLILSSLLLLALAPTALASTTWYVNGVNGSDHNNCKSPQTACKTIGHAISLASSGDSIMVAAATYTENLTIGVSLKVIGAGAKTTIIDGGGVNTVVTISNVKANTTLSRVTITNGSGRGFRGGGIDNVGTLTITKSIIAGNSVHLDRCRFCNGGGITNRGGTLTINNSTISGNSVDSTCYDVCAASGGGISNFGTLTISNSTLNGNSARVKCQKRCGAFGGGISMTPGTLTINSSTISGNSASVGGGIYLVSGQATLQNTIVANNLSANCAGGAMTSNGYNLSSDRSCNFNNTGDLNSTDPVLGTLGNYGGPTQTIPLLSGSPAIDAGNPGGCTDGDGHLLRTDQRGKPRPDHEDTGGCDMGAYERQKD